MWVFVNGHKFTSTGSPYKMSASPNKMTLAAGEVWVTLSGRQVGVYHFFGQTGYYDDGGTIGEEGYREQLIDLSSYFTNDPYYICTGENCVYVFEKGTKTSLQEEEVIKSFVEIDTTTYQVKKHITVPDQAHCYPTYAKFKLWFTTLFEPNNDERQKLFYYDLLTDEWSSGVNIPGTTQFRPHKIKWAYEDYIFVDGFNDNCVFKFNVSTGAYVSQIITNRKPLHMFAESTNKKLMVAGYDGMISVVDQVADSYSNDYATTEEVESFAFDQNYIWAVTPTLERVGGTAPTFDVIRMDHDEYGSPLTEKRDSTIDSFSETDFYDILIVPQYNHNRWTGSTVTSIQEPQRIVLLTNNSLFVAWNLYDSWSLYETRNYYFTVKGTAMVATGPEQYYGETD